MLIVLNKLGIAKTVTVADCHSNRCHSNRRPLYELIGEFGKKALFSCLMVALSESRILSLHVLTLQGAALHRGRTEGGL